ncbi:integrase [Methylobacterium sp. Leaf456]|uniref:DUF6538 domain-containing protein n=1 Tax=Methylobacterium sp. Leaf456 TaxID=1736382 RepID=UPI0006FB1D4F|nr:DUF6538 domain-containing protein [Methylobacterium sp. Leaf456]KQT61694.1 integrase [Methylobacterium sp. Leaf456]
MHLAMTRPWKHPKTGVYWLRKRVPADLKPFVGRVEVTLSLKTKDPAEAKQRILAALAELEARWANLKVGPRTLSEREAHELSAPAYERWLAAYREDPSEQKVWRTDLADRMWAPSAPVEISCLMDFRFDPDMSRLREQEAWCVGGADDLLAAQGLVVDEASRLKVAKAIAAAIQRASLVLARLARGEVEEPVPVARIAEVPKPGLVTGSGVKAVPFDNVEKGWAAERKPARKTAYEWPRVLKQFQAHLGHDDAARVTPDDLIAWKAAMIEAGLKAKTIRDAKIAPVRAILQWAVDNRLLSSNPAQKVGIQVKTRASEARRGFTDEEAKTILRAAAKETDTALRWVPLLCAYSGARVAEACQLRAEDIVSLDGIKALRFTEEAGPLKTASSERIVPVHPAVIEAGFLTFVELVSSGPLFPTLKPDKFGSRGGTGTKVIGPWVRGLGLTDERLAPNHSWRHRFKTLGRRHGLAGDMVDAIVGHAKRTVGDGYGEFPMPALHRELSKIPALVVD